MESNIEVSEYIRGKGVPFERIRRITGYLVGDMNRWGDSKRAEEHDRVKHETSNIDLLETTESSDRFSEALVY